MSDIRKAIPSDIDALELIYEHVHDAIESGAETTGWRRGIYPTRKTAEAALKRGDMFIFETDGKKPAASAIINMIQGEEYKLCDWKIPAEPDKVMVLHTLSVDPKYTGQGIGKTFIKFYEEYAVKHGCKALRMDTNALNTKARALYKKLGFIESGIIPCTFEGLDGINLVCLEKAL